MSAKHAATLLSTRRFLPMLGAQIFGAFNDQFLKMALITLVTWKELSIAGLHPTVLAPVAGAVFTAPFFLFSAMAGQVADKYDKALVLLRVKQAEIFIMLLAAFALIANIPALMLLTVALMGAQSAFFSPTRNSVLPQWLKPEELVTGNALINGFVSVFVLLGMAFGILLITTANGPKTVSAILLVFAFLGWLSIRKAPPAPSQSPEIKIDRWIFPTIVSTMKFAFKKPDVLRPMLGTAWYYWIVAAVLILMPIYIKDVLHYEPVVFMTVMILFTFGAIFGAIACMLFAKNNRAVFMSAIGALGLTVINFDLFFLCQNVTGLAFSGYVPAAENAAAVLGTFDQFLTMPSAKHFMISLSLSAFFASLFVIPLNAMAQQRAEAKTPRAFAGGGGTASQRSDNIITARRRWYGLGRHRAPLYIYHFRDNHQHHHGLCVLPRLCAQTTGALNARLFWDRLGGDFQGGQPWRYDAHGSCVWGQFCLYGGCHRASGEYKARGQPDRYIALTLTLAVL